MKAGELISSVLDWAVAKAAGIPVKLEYSPAYCVYTPPGKRSLYKFQPSINWKQGGPIIERECLVLVARKGCAPVDEWGKWFSHTNHDGEWFCGPTPLIAAMRCFVASKLGNEVDVPKELL